MADIHDREDIVDVLVRYATGIDRKDWALFRTCFTDDCRSDYGDIGGWSDLEGLTSFMITAHEPMARTLHRITNPVVTVQGEQATARSYVHAVLVLADDAGNWFEALGLYDDALVKTDGTWRIAERRFTMVRFTTSEAAVGQPAS